MDNAPIPRLSIRRAKSRDMIRVQVSLGLPSIFSRLALQLRSFRNPVADVRCGAGEHTEAPRLFSASRRPVSVEVAGGNRSDSRAPSIVIGTRPSLTDALTTSSESSCVTCQARQHETRAEMSGGPPSILGLWPLALAAPAHSLTTAAPVEVWVGRSGRRSFHLGGNQGPLPSKKQHGPISTGAKYHHF